MADKKIIGSFNYIVLSLASYYVKNNINSEAEKAKISLQDVLSKFDLSNDFGIDKVSLFPFLTTIGNGKKKELLDFFTEDENDFFESTEKGVIHNSISELLSKNDDELIFTIDKNSLKFKEKFKQYTSVEEYKKTISSLQIDEILSYLDKSISFIHSDRVKNFANQPYDVLLEYCESEALKNLHLWFSIDDNNKEEYKKYFTEIVSEEIYALTPTS